MIFIAVGTPAAADGSTNLDYIEAVARDFCPDNDPSVSKALMITVRDIEGVNISDDSELGKLFAFLDQAIKHQKKAIDNTDTLVTHADSLWKDMHGNPFKPEDVNKFLGLHRRSILGEQGNVRNVLIQAGRTTAINSPIVTRLKQISENEAVDANDGDLIFFQFGPTQKVHTVMANLRLHIARKLGMIPETGSGGEWNFLWVVDPPLFERNEEKKLLLGVLGMVPTTEAMSMAMTYMVDPLVRNEACFAVVAICDKIVLQNPDAVADAIGKVLEATNNRNVTRRAKQVLNKAK